MQKRFSEALNELRGLIKEWSAPSVLIAVSGGIDSMCMAELFASMEQSLPFAVAHCNFRLRGEESDGDEALVRKWAQEHNVLLHIKSFDTQEYASANGISIEMAARDLRYGWFADLCREYGYAAVAVAHNANDNAETLILNMLRGSGLNGLTGMSLLSVVPGTSIPLVRPLLGCTRKQIEGYVFSHKTEYRDDSTNASSEYKRNRIRNEVFPIFETINPSFVHTLNREMDYFSEAEDIVADWCKAQIESILTDVQAPAIVGISLPSLLSVSHWRYLLYHILEPYGFNSSVLASLEDLLASDRTSSGKRFESPEYILLVERERMLVLPKDEKAVLRSLSDEGDASMIVSGAGIYSFNGSKLRVEVLPYKEDMSLKQPEGVLVADADRLRFPFILRQWRTGDWFVPLGMRGKKKVSDLFADLKYDTFRKKSAIVIVDFADYDSAARHISAVAGVRIDDRCKVVSCTRDIVRISLI